MDTFDWTEYFEKNKCVAVPEELFAHVEASLSNGIKQGMLLEVCHKSNPDIYWIAEITMVCGHLLRVKYLGAKDEFWCDISTTKVHALGWCGKYDEPVEPPDEVNAAHGDGIIEVMRAALLRASSAPQEALQRRGQAPLDRLQLGMKVEVQSLTDPYKYWIATIEENLGGRLALRYDGAEEGARGPCLFYSSPRLAGFGFVTSKGSPWQFRYPGSVNRFSCKNKLSAQLRQCAEEAIKEPTPPDLFQSGVCTAPAHSVCVGMRLEALDPRTRSSVRPAAVARVFNNVHFLVVLDDCAGDPEDDNMAWLCDCQHPYIYPIGWAKQHGVPFTSPRAWRGEAFDWDEYLAQTGSVPAPDYCFGSRPPLAGLEAGMMLEAVSPLDDRAVHVARVARLAQHMACVELLGAGLQAWYWQRDLTLFPAGWCDANDHELHVPPPPAPAPPPPAAALAAPAPDDEWCDRIYFNYKCYAGPSLSRSKLAQLPQHVGPGRLALVLREVLNKLISAAYKPAKLLRSWEATPPPAPGMRLDMLRAKLKTSTYHAYVEVATQRAQLEAFCRGVCRRLQACPALLAPRRAPAPCACATADKASFHHAPPAPAPGERRGRPRGSFKKKKKPPQDKPQPEKDKEAKGDGGESSDSSRSSPARAARAQRPATRVAPPAKEAPWESTACAKKADSDSDSRTSDSREKNISDVSDGEEPELKKLKFTSEDPQPTDNDMFERGTSLAALRARLRLEENPALWSVEDVHAYLLEGGESARVAARLRREGVDGLAFMLLDQAALRRPLGLVPRHAMRLTRHVALLRCHYYMHNEDPPL